MYCTLLCECVITKNIPIIFYLIITCKRKILQKKQMNDIPKGIIKATEKRLLAKAAAAAKQTMNH